MHKTETREIVTAYEGMGDFLYRKWMDGEIEPDDEWRDPETGESFAIFGRRVIVEGGYGIDYTRHETIAAAWQQMDGLHTHRAPVWDWDAVIVENGRGYAVTMEGVRIGEYADQDAAYLALARAMVDAGCFPDAFYVNDRGNWHRIDEDIRELHDAGGDKMREDLR